MTVLDPELVSLFALTTGFATAMVWLAARAKMLELRDSRRRCPACGVSVPRGRDCGCSR